MNKDFIEEIYREIVENGMVMYKDLFENTEIDNNTIEYWANSIIFYNSLSSYQKDILFKIIEQTIIDTISSVFSILDNSFNNYNIDISINSINTDDELQDTFLDFVEEKN